MANAISRRILFASALLALIAPPAQAQTFRSAAAEAPVLQAGFGGALAISNHTVVIGEPNNTIRPGTIYLARKIDGEWKRDGTITASDAANRDRFGASIAVDGAVMVVGATARNDGRGAIYVFRRTGQAWAEVTRLTASDAAAGDGLGATVAIAGDVILAGAPGHAEETGAVYVFRNAGGTWRQVAKLPGAAEKSLFGAALAIGGGRALVGAPLADSGTGAVHAYRVEGGALIESGRLQLTGATANDRLGVSLALDESEAVVGGPGVVHHLRWQGGSWHPSTVLTAADTDREAGFGYSLALDAKGLLVGAPRLTNAAGGAYYFPRQGSGFGAPVRLTSERAERNDLLGLTVAISGDIAAVGMLGDDLGAGSVVVFERDAAGEWRASEPLSSPPERLASIRGGKVECAPDKGQAAVFGCSQVDLVSFISVADLGGGRGVRLNDVWGWTDPQTEREYALVGRTDGTSFVDVTDPANPVYVGQLLRTEGSPPATWRDIKVYRDHAYVVADASGAHGIQVLDLTKLRRYAGEPIEFAPDTTYTGINSAHNIVINEETGFAYAVGSSSGGETCGGGLHMVDIREPTKPKFAGCFSDPQTGRASTGYSHDAQCVVYRGPDATYRGREICIGSNETAISIADVTEKRRPKAVSRASYPNVGYSHQGWFDEEHRYFYMNDELDELNGTVPRTRTIIWDLSDLDDPRVAGEFLGTTEASDHNLYIKGDLMYQSHYQAGLRIVDISDRTRPVEVGYFDTVPFGDNKPGFGGSWSNYPFFKSGNVVVTSGEEGLFVVRKKDTKPIS